MASKLFLTLPDKPFRCESCGRKFTYEPHLTADGHWLCAVCGKEVVERSRSRHSEKLTCIDHPLLRLLVRHTLRANFHSTVPLTAMRFVAARAVLKAGPL